MSLEGSCTLSEEKIASSRKFDALARMFLNGEKPVSRTLSEDSMLQMGESSHFSDYSSISWSTPMLDKEVPLDVLFGAFVDCHQRQLTYIEKAGWDEETKLKEKVRVLESYVTQLEEQNDVLINTASELERQTRKRVAMMEIRLQKSAKTTKEVVLHLHEYEEHFRNIAVEKSHLETNLDDLTHQHSSLKVENGFLRDQNANLRHDLHALLHIIQEARSTGHWELECVTFCELTPNEVFGPIRSFSPAPSGDSLMFSESVHASEDARFHTYSISDRGSMAPSHHSSITNLHDTEQASSPHSKTDHTDVLVQLRNEVCFLQRMREQTQLELLEKDRTIAGLETQITSLNYEMTILKAECERRLLDFHVYGMKNHSHQIGRLGMLLSSPNSLPCICQQRSTSSKIVDSLEWENKIEDFKSKVNGFGSSNIVDDGENSANISKLTASDVNFTSPKTDSAFEHKNSEAQINIKSTTVSIQTEEPKKEKDAIVNSPVEALNKTDFEQLKEHLRRAEDKAAAKEMLVAQLQNHLQISAKEVELKDKTLENIENKLDTSRQDCNKLKETIFSLENEILRLKEDIESSKVTQTNLSQNVEAREEIVKEMKQQEQSLQEQKRTLMIQVDEQAEQLLNCEEELLIAKSKLEINSAEVELQKITIQNLQEALVRMTRVKNELKKDGETTTIIQSSNISSFSIARRALSQSSIYDI